MRDRIKRRGISLLLCMTLLITSFVISEPENVYADVTMEDEAGNSGTEITEGMTVTRNDDDGYRYTWPNYAYLTNQGYRFYVVDKDFNLVSNVLDINYNSRPSGSLNYYSTATQDLNQSNDHTIVTWNQVSGIANGITPLPALTWNPNRGLQPDGSYDGRVMLSNGDEFKEWVINGLGGETIDNIWIKMQEGTAGTNTNKVTTSIGSSNTSYGGTSANVYDAIYGKGANRSVGTLYNIYGSRIFTNTGVVSSTARAYADNTYVSTSCQNQASYYVSRYIENTGGNSTQAKLSAYASLMSTGRYNQDEALSAILNITTTRSSSKVKVGSIEDTSIEYAQPTITDLDQIIATAEGNQYLLDIFNTEMWGEKLLHFNLPYVDNSKPVSENISNNNFYLIVEPVYWLKYAMGWKQVTIPAHSETRYTFNWKTHSTEAYTEWVPEETKDNDNYVEDSHYTYGSLRDIITYFYKVKGYSGSRPNAWRVTNGYGPNSLIVAQKDMEFGATVIHKVTYDNLTGLAQNRQLSMQYLYENKDNIGYAMHIYSSRKGVWTKTRDDGDGVTNYGPADGTMHAAPVKDDPNGYEQCITIVKTYERRDSAGNVVETHTFTRTKEPDVVYILKENPWRLEDWYVSTRASTVRIDDTSGYGYTQDDTFNYYGAKSEVSGNITQSMATKGSPSADQWKDNQNIPYEDGDLRINIDATTPQTTLYLLYVQDTDVNSLGGEVKITESEISAVQSIGGTGVLERSNLGDFDNILLDNQQQKNGDTYNYTIYRGDDKLTLAQYMINDLSSTTEITVASWVNYFGIGGMTSLGREKISFNSSYNLIFGVGETRLEIPVTAVVEVYAGKKKDNIDVSAPNTSETNSVRASSGVTVKFNPYIWMTTEDFSGTKTLVNVLGEYTRGTVPNDYAEVTFNHQGTLQVESNMWATDKMIQELENASGEAIGTNTALKGGANYTLTTPDPASIKVTTYQTIIDDNTNYLMTANSADELGISSDAAVIRHQELTEEVATNLLDQFKIEQYVNKNATSSPAGSTGSTSTPSGSVKVSSGSNISSLSNGSSTTSTDSKYWLHQDGTIANSCYMETRINNTTYKYYRFFTLPNGNVYMVSGKSYDECQSQMVSIIESAKANNGIWTGNMILAKGADTDSITDSTAKSINDKTRVIKKLLEALEINTGDDNTAPWALSDGNWYNEGCLGLTVIVQSTQIDIGILSVDGRGVVLDPKLIPSVTGKSGQNTDIFSSAYKVRYTGTEYLGTFRGLDIQQGDSEFQKLFKVSNTFYIPNSTVTDNK